MNNPPLIPQAFATSGSKNTIQDTRQAGQDEEDATWSSGFPNVTMQPSESGGLPPKGMDFNGIFNAISSPIVHLQKGGAYKFDSDYAAKIGGYSIGSVLQSNDGKSSYVSLINNNTTDFNSNPDSIGTDWAPWAGESIKPDSGTPIGAIEYFGTSAAPAGYLIANGAAVGRTTYPDLFAAIGTAFGEGDGSTTFNLPDLIGRFAQGSNTPGQKIEAGLPNIEGQWNRSKTRNIISSEDVVSGAFDKKTLGIFQTFGDSSDSYSGGNLTFNASRSNPIYGASSTVQPPALTLLPCIKAFDAATNPGLIDMTALAQEMADKTDKMTAANAAMPSDRYVDLTLPVSLSTITAPADGYIFFEKITTAANQYVALYVNAPNSLAIYGANNDLPAANAYPFVLIPVKKGAVVTVEYNAAGTYTRFRFIYANGSVQQ